MISFAAAERSLIKTYSMNELNKLLGTQVIHFGKIKLTGWDLITVALILVMTKVLLFFIKRWMIRYNIRKYHKEWDGNSNAIFLLVRYFLWIIAAGIALDVMNVNLSFLVAGSAALLVGIGFGLQQIFQDIISGIFLLIERKVKMGDVMEVDSYIGRISHIGLRTSTIVTRDGTIIIVPNHKFITDNVLNWSNAEQVMRFKIGIGVAYGSDVPLVSGLLREAAHEHPHVIETEEHPLVIRLVEFGDSALKFELLFWTTQKFAVEDVKSDLRFKALDKLNKHGITIPFPQRDLHIRHGGGITTQ